MHVLCEDSTVKLRTTNMSFTTSNFPVPPLTQALQSTTFVRPPLNGSLTFPELIDWHLEHSENHPLLVFYDEGKVTTIHWAEAVRAIHSGVHLLRRTFGWKQYSTVVPIVGILASSGKVPFKCCSKNFCL